MGSILSKSVILFSAEREAPRDKPFVVEWLLHSVAFSVESKDDVATVAEIVETDLFLEVVCEQIY